MSEQIVLRCEDSLEGILQHFSMRLCVKIK